MTTGTRLAARVGMKMTVTIVGALVIAGCPDNSDVEDCSGLGQEIVVSCQGATARGVISYGDTTSRTIACSRELGRDDVAACTGGCAISSYTGGLDGAIVFDPSILCAETPVAQVGDACDAMHPCLPVRATLAADGTVIHENDLACGAAGTCVAIGAPAPTRSPCPASTVAAYAAPNVSGVIADPEGTLSACLIAWDPATQTTASATTSLCLGDWDCPDGYLCDDQMTIVSSASVPVAVCKPGPRGTLTPAML